MNPRQPNTKYTRKCRYCSGLFSNVYLHEKACVNKTDEQRLEVLQRHESLRRFEAESRGNDYHPGAEGITTGSPLAGKAPTPPPEAANGKVLNNRRVQVTISFTMDALRTVLLELAPSFSIDKVEVQ